MPGEATERRWMASHWQLSYNLDPTRLAATMRRKHKKLSTIDYWFYGFMVVLLVVVLAIFLGPSYLQW
jgi:hypothetical protein